MITLKKSCRECNGTGYLDDQICWRCGGDIESEGHRFDETVITLPLLEQLADILDKCNDIIAEQASQRTDLTAALTQIWNKVKDLE